MELAYKGLSRCFVFDKFHIKKVEEIIKEVDEFEYDYLPDDWITMWDDSNNELSTTYWVYNGKFDIDIPKLIKVCADQKIGIIIRSKPQNDLDNCF